jgi:hypothetical protein
VGGWVDCIVGVSCDVCVSVWLCVCGGVELLGTVRINLNLLARRLLAVLLVAVLLTTTSP